MSVSTQLFKHAMAQLVSGVCVVAVRGGDGGFIGMTASAVTSLSLEPPMVLVCIDRRAEIHDALVSAPIFGLNVLAATQAEFARRFATRGQQHFDAVHAAGTPGGLPRIPGALACLDCRRDGVYAGGDHSIVTGTVEWAAVDSGSPLCYFLGRYTELES